jgi:hypothetical protein
MIVVAVTVDVIMMTVAASVLLAIGSFQVVEVL